MSRLTSIVLQRRSLAAQIVIGLLCVAAATCFRVATDPLLPIHSAWQPFFLAVLAASIIGGGGSAASALCGSILVGGYLFGARPSAPLSTPELASITLFSAVGTAISLIALRLRHAVEEAHERGLALEREVERRDAAIR